MPSYQLERGGAFYRVQDESETKKVNDDHARDIMNHLPIFFLLDDPIVLEARERSH